MALSRITEAVASFTDLTIGDDLTLTDDFLMASDASIIKFGADADVTLTHVHNTGLLLNSTSVIQFNDASQNIGAPSATVLDINATDEIELNATLVDVNANLDVSGTIVSGGTLTATTSIGIGSAVLTEAELEFLDGITAGTAAASKALILDGSTNISGIGTIGSGAITSSSTIQGTTITATTAFVPDASDGAALGTTSLEFSDLFLADGAVINFGDDQDVTLTHVADTGLLLNGTSQLQFNDASQNITAPSATVLDINATDEIELNATLVDVNANLDVSGTYTGGGLMTTGGNIVIPDSGNIGSASDTDAIAIASNGQVTFSQTLIGTALDISGDIDVDGTTNLDVVDIDGAVDMASTLQVDGAITSSAGATITVADNSAGLTIVSTDADGNSGPQMNFSRASGSPADDDYIGRMNFIGRNDAGQDFVGVDVLTRINDVTDGTEDASFFITTMENGSQVSKMEFLPGETVFNQGSADLDFRVESNGDTSMIFVDAGNDKVGIKDSAPVGIVSIKGGDSGVTAATSYANELVIENNTNGGITFNCGASNSSTILFQNSSNAEDGQIAYRNSEREMRFSVAGAEKFRMEGNGRLIVGKTTNNSSVAGVVIETGQSSFTRDGGQVILFNRHTNDGSIIGLGQNDATEGTIYYIAVDGVEAATGTVNLAYELEVGLTVQGVTIADLGMQFEITTVPNITFVIEGTEDFNNWVKLISTSSVDGNFVYIDNEALTGKQRFYRIYVTE